MSRLLLLRSFVACGLVLGTAFWLLPTTETWGQSDKESCLLSDQRHAGETSSVRVALQVKGKLRHAAGDNQSNEVPMSVSTRLTYRETFVEDSLGATQGQRLYEIAKASLKASDHTETKELSEQHRRVRAILRDGKTQLFAEEGQLSRAELDVISLPGDSLAVYKLLPGKTVSVGDQWKHDADDLAALLNLDHVGVNETKSQLDGIERGLAKMRLTGLIKGSADGVATQMRVVADYRYDTILKRVSWLQLNIEEHREAGLLNPEFVVNAELRMLIEPAQERLAIRPVKDPTDDLLLLQFADDELGLRLLYPRQWRIVDDRPQHLTFRLTKGDKNVAQCALSRLADLPAGRQLGLEEFQSDIQKTLEKQFVEFEDARRETRPDGLHVCRVVVRGMVSSVPVRWIYMHLADDNGQRASLVFTMDAEMVDLFATDDAIMADSLQLVQRVTAETPPVGGPTEAASRPVRAQRR